jgi:hypothetical protein
MFEQCPYMIKQVKTRQPESRGAGEPRIMGNIKQLISKHKYVLEEFILSWYVSSTLEYII